VELDARSLALFRVGLGLLVAWDAAVAWGNAAFFYADVGFLPRDVLQSRLWESSWQWSVHAWHGAVSYQQTWIAVQGLAALALAAGWRTRWMTALCWALAASLEARNPLVTNGADAVIRLLLFWSLFLPLGAWWSVDAWRRRRKAAGVRPQTVVRTVPGACFLVQVGCVYFFAALLKDMGAWWVQGTALQTALHLDLFVTGPGLWLREEEGLCRLLTRGAWLLELAGPLLLLLVPWARQTVRLVVCAAFMLFHAAIGLAMDIGAFPWILFAAWAALLPGKVWDGWRRPAGPPAQSGTETETHTVSRSIAVFCALCLGFVIAWNIRGTDFPRWEKWLPRTANGVAFALRLDQYWSMFAPVPTRDDGWFVFRAGLSDGTEVDLLRGGRPTEWRKPGLGSAAFPDARWQKLLMNLWLQRYAEYRMPFGDRLVQRWNAEQGGLSQVVAWEFYFMHEPTGENGVPVPVKPVLLATRERVSAGQ
jgi:hypothetical protein